MACQTPCLDIDSERSYWQTLRGKRGLTFAWYSYPGLVLAFFLLLQGGGGADHDYFRSGRWAYDTTVLTRIWTPLVPSLAAPRAPAGKPQPSSLSDPTRPEQGHGPPRSQAQAWRQDAPSTDSWSPHPWHNKHESLLDINLEPVQSSPDEADFSREVPNSTDQQIPAKPAEFLGGSRKPGS